MSEVDARPPATRGRGAHRGGRGGFGRGEARGGRKLVNGSNKDSTAQFDESLDDQGELGEMKKKYGSELIMLKDMFPDWNDMDLVFALHEADGDIPSTVDHITQGNVSQFAEVKSGKDRARSKVKETTAMVGSTEKPATRSVRGRGGLESTRGGRGRASERGRGGHRGGRGGHATVDGSAKDAITGSVPTTESTAWDTTANASAKAVAGDALAQDTSQDVEIAGQSAWSNVVAAESTPATASEGLKSTLIPDNGPKKSWASMFAPKPAPPPVKKPAVKQDPPAELVASGHIPPAVDPKEDEAGPILHQQPTSAMQQPPDALLPPALTASSAVPSEGDDLTITPSKDPLTEENVEHLPDESHPPATQTVASTAGSLDPRNLTPMPNQQAPIGRPPIGGFATSAYRAAGAGMRSASLQRRVQEQQEAVVMPGHNAMDRAAVQFGSMGLNGEPGSDVDEDREDPETRQAPQHSPPSQPRTSLPPVPRQGFPNQQVAESVQLTKQAPGLPPAAPQNHQQIQEAAMNHGIPNDPVQMTQQYHQYGRYGQQNMHQDAVAQQQKSYDPFGHQAQTSQYDQYGVHTQQIPEQQQQAHGGFGGISSATDASAQYSAEQQRTAYQHYYGGSYGPQETRGAMGQNQQQEAGMAQQRTASGFGAGPTESGYQTQTQQQTQTRFGDTTGSGHNTPNPHVASQQQQGNANNPQQQQQQSMHQAQSHQQQGGYGAAHPGYPYGHPYYNSPYQQAYNNQFGYSPQLGGYGGSFPGKQSMYGASHGYGMAPQSTFDQHSSSPANTGAFGQTQQSNMRSAGGMSGLGGGLDDYGRGSAQSHAQNSGFGGASDPFARSTSGFGGQGSYGQPSSGSAEESLKSLSDNKGGPSPGLGQPGRPGSATNSAGNSTQTGLPTPQSHQSGFGGYPGFPGQGHYSGLGGLGSQQQHQQGALGGQGYGSYGAGGFGQAYGGYSSRGGWGSNYGAH